MKCLNDENMFSSDKLITFKEIENDPINYIHN